MIDQRKRKRPDDYFTDWKEREALAEAMIPMVGKLARERNVKCYIYGKSLVNLSVLDIMKTHRWVRQVEDNELSEFETFRVLQAMENLALGASHIDIGRLSVAYFDHDAGGTSGLEGFVESELEQLIDAEYKKSGPRDVVLFGFGRIGRLMARILVAKTDGGDNLRLRAVVVRRGKADDDLTKRASLLRRDSVHGAFDGTIRVDEERQSFVANGNEIKVIYADAPEDVDYEAHGINDCLVIDNTGVWRDKDGLSRHLKAKGVSKVILTAPGKGDIKNIVAGINHHEITADDRILSAASCTTNAIVPPLKALNDEYSIQIGHVETVHAFTNDQNLLDNYHKKFRRGRSAPLNMVITETGAASAVAKVLPELAGKLTGNAVRVPTPNVSLAILNLELNTVVERDALNDLLRRVAADAALRADRLLGVQGCREQ